MSDTVSPVFVGVDGSYIAIRAARWAAAVADRFGAPLCIVHARPYVGHNPSDAIAGVRAAAIAEQEESAQAILRSAEDAVRADFPHLPVTTFRLSESVDEALTELSRSARMIVLGCDEVSLGTAILVGSTTMAIAAHSTCPVVAWRGEAVVPTVQPIVIGVDGDDDNRVAVPAAFELADRLGVGVVAVHAWSTRRPAGDVTLPFMIDWSAVEKDERQHLSERLAPWIDLYPDVDVTCVVDPDKPSKALLRQATNAQLVAVGSRGRSLLAGAALGSTGLNLLHHSAVPVMICRSRGTED
jgi:nucleotide-binding universal stress UspA family protein